MWPSEYLPGCGQTLRPCGPGADRDPREQPAGARVDRVDLARVAAREPEHAAVRRDAAHVGSAVRDAPRAHHAMAAEADHAHGSGVAVRGVQVAPVTARVEAVCARAGAEEADHPVLRGAYLPEPVGHHVGDVEDAAVRCELHVLRHGSGPQVDRPQHAMTAQIDAHELPGELAACECGVPVRGEVHVIDPAAGDGERLLQAEGAGVPEVEAGEPFRDDDRRAPVRA